MSNPSHVLFSVICVILGYALSQTIQVPEWGFIIVGSVAILVALTVWENTRN